MADCKTTTTTKRKKTTEATEPAQEPVQEKDQAEQAPAVETPPARTYQLKEEGVYKGSILKHSLELSSKNTLGLQLMVKLTHRETEELEWEELEKPFTRPITLWLSEGAKDNTIASLRWLGFEGTSSARLNPKHPEAANFVGLELFAVCKHGEYKGRPQEKWNMQRRRKPSDEASLVAAANDTDAWFKDEMEAALNPDAIPEVNF